MMILLYFILGVRYVSAAERFPLTQLHLWCHDGVSTIYYSQMSCEKSVMCFFLVDDAES